MRVLCFCEKWESGGVEAFVTGLYECMDRDGVEVDVVACIRDENALFTPRLATLGIEVGVLSGRLWAVRDNLRMFRALLERGRYDAVHLNLFEGMALAYAREAKRAGVPRVIAHSHNTDLHPGRLRAAKLAVHRACVRRFAGCADRRWAPSEAAAQFLFGSRDWEHVKNGIVPERFAFDAAQRERVRGELGLGDSFALGCVGRLCAQKNQAFLLDVLARMPEARLVLAGSGEDEGRLCTRAAELGVDGRVAFCGAVHDMPALYSAVDALCVPSLFEGLGIVAIEGQAAGLPVVCSPAVPPEVGVTDLYRAVSLDAGRWAGVLGRLRGTERRSRADELRRAGYDMRATAAFVRAAYAEGTR